MKEMTENLLRAELHNPNVNRSMLVAFVAVVNLSPFPLCPEQAARRFGVASPATVRALREEALRFGAIAVGRSGQKILVARRGHIFDEVRNAPGKNVLGKNVPTHSTLVAHYKTTHTQTTTTRGTMNAAEAGPDEVVVGKSKPSSSGEPRRLTDWKQSKFFKDRVLVCDEAAEVMSMSGWCTFLDVYGGAPGHLRTAYAYQQASEIAQELAFRAQGRLTASEAMIGLAQAACAAHKAGKVINSLGFIAERLVGRINRGDLSWYFELPSRLDSNSFARAYDVARQALEGLRATGYPTCDEHLLGTRAVDVLHGYLEEFGHAAVLAGIRQEARAATRPQFPVRCWSMFYGSIEAAVDVFQMIINADEAQMLGAELRADRAACLRFVDGKAAEHSTDRLAIASVLVRALQDMGREGQVPPGSLTSWKLFS